MFDKKYKKVLELLDNEISTARQMFEICLEDASNTNGLSEQQIYDESVLRRGKWSMVDKSIARLEGLCELKREILEKIGQ